jgi:repressor LexA
MNRLSLTAVQLECIDFIRARLSQSEVAPSYDEMKDALGLKSKSCVHRLVVALETRGAIRRIPQSARTIQLVTPSDKYQRGYEAGYSAALKKQRAQ